MPARENRFAVWLKRIDGRLLILLAVFTYYGLVWGTLQNFAAVFDHCPTLFCDFVRYYYPTGQTIFDSATPAFGFHYSPFVAMLLYPFGREPMEIALMLWGVLQFSSAVFLYWIPTSEDSLKKSTSALLIYTFLFITGVALLHNFKWGQMSILITLFIVAALLYYQRGNRLLAGFLLALAIAIKYYPVLFLLYFVFKRDFKFVLLCAGMVVAFMIVVPVVGLGADRTLQFYSQLSTNARLMNFDLSALLDPNSQYFPNVLGRLLGLTPDDPLRQIFRFAGYALGALNIALIWLVVRARLPQDGLWSFALLFTSLPFWVSTSWPHYFHYLPLVQILLYLSVRTSAAPLWLRAVKLLVLLASAVFSNVILVNLIGDLQIYSSKGLLLFANLLLLFLLYLELAPHLAPTLRDVLRQTAPRSQSASLNQA